MSVLIKTLFFLFSVNVFAQELSINIYHSEATSYLHFLSSGFNDSFTSGSMKTLIKSKRVRGFEDEKNVFKYREMLKFLHNGYNFQSVKTRPSGFYGIDGFYALSVTNPSVEDFEKNISILVPYQGVKLYFDLKKIFYPQFQERIWRPTLGNQSGEAKKVKALLESTHFSSLLRKSARFYQSNYPWQVPFKVALIPIDDRGQEKRHTSAQNLKDIQVVPYVITRGMRDNMDVVFHEFCHALYEGQSQKKKREIEDFYLRSHHSHAQFTYRYLNEVLATALGNGWFREILDGKLSEEKWYSVVYIDKMAKALLPEIKRYLKRKKSLDREFYKKTLEVAKEIFPEGPRELNPNFISLRIISEHSSLGLRTLGRKLRENFRIQSLHSSSELGEKELKTLNDIGNSSTFIASKNKEGLLGKLGSVLSKDLRKKIREKENFLAIFKIRGRYVYWFNSDVSKFAASLKKLKALTLLPEKYLVMDL